MGGKLITLTTKDIPETKHPGPIYLGRTFVRVALVDADLLVAFKMDQLRMLEIDELIECFSTYLESALKMSLSCVGQLVLPEAAQLTE